MENSFGKYLVKLRNQKAISQRKLAELAGVTNSTISRLEADLVTPDLKTLETLLYCPQGEELRKARAYFEQRHFLFVIAL